jgi:hypothetical protein
LTKVETTLRWGLIGDTAKKSHVKGAEDEQTGSHREQFSLPSGVRSHPEISAPIQLENK